jgi:hypothetical protein
VLVLYQNGSPVGSSLTLANSAATGHTDQALAVVAGDVIELRVGTSAGTCSPFATNVGVGFEFTTD